MTIGERPKVIVIGRSDFHTGIGTVSAAALELFSRSFDVGFWSPRETALVEGSTVTLPTGRVVPVVEPRDAEVYFFSDVLWNGYDDYNYAQVPQSGFRIAHMAFDSDRLPDEWVRILNERFDLALFSSEYLMDAARESGVTTPVGALPIGLDLELLLARRFRAPVPTKTRFGTVSAYHTRKGLDLLVEAFLLAFGNDSTVELVIHSNLQIGDTFARVTALAAEAPVQNIRLSTGNLSTDDKNELIDSFDVYVNVSAGEGYSIGPREALSLGKPLVLSAIPAHDDMAGVPGVFSVEPVGKRPAIYPEIGNRAIGRQSIMRPSDVASSLVLARSFAQSQQSLDTVRARRARATEFAYTRLTVDYAELLAPDGRSVRPERVPSAFTRLPSEALPLAVKAAGRHGAKLGPRKRVVPVHDGGFFSIFNTFLSHLVWGLREDDVTMVVPDWDAGRLLERSGDTPITSFCYGKPGEGNMWLSLFEPLFDLTPEEMNSEEFLYGNSDRTPTQWNEDREPNLTYVNAYNLYMSPDFLRIRRQYKSVIDRHIRLLPQFRREIDTAVVDKMTDRFTVGVHVKHPSHAIEQPGQRMADRYAYVERVRQELADSGVSEHDSDWGVFVATDQERVVNLFNEEFGDHVIRFDDVVRVTEESDEKFDELSDEEKVQEGHQLQHLMASDTLNWSSRLAWEVWRDAEVMASCTSLIHAVSNVATAVAFMGPDVQMRYFEV